MVTHAGLRESGDGALVESIEVLEQLVWGVFYFLDSVILAARLHVIDWPEESLFKMMEGDPPFAESVIIHPMTHPLAARWKMTVTLLPLTHQYMIPTLISAIHAINYFILSRTMTGIYFPLWIAGDTTIFVKSLVRLHRNARRRKLVEDELVLVQGLTRIGPGGKSVMLLHISLTPFLTHSPTPFDTCSLTLPL